MPCLTLLLRDKLCNFAETSSELSNEPLLEGVSFMVKYLGSTLVSKASGEEATADAIRVIVAMAKHRKLAHVKITISLDGVVVQDAVTLEPRLHVSVYRISYCSADATYDRVFAFIATNRNSAPLECHAFLCCKRKEAHTATLTIAHAFNLAFELWQNDQKCPNKPSSTKNALNSNDNSLLLLHQECCPRHPCCMAAARKQEMEANNCDTSLSSGYDSAGAPATSTATTSSTTSSSTSTTTKTTTTSASATTSSTASSSLRRPSSSSEVLLIDLRGSEPTPRVLEAAVADARLMPHAEMGQDARQLQRGQWVRFEEEENMAQTWSPLELSTPAHRRPKDITAPHFVMNNLARPRPTRTRSLNVTPVH